MGYVEKLEVEVTKLPFGELATVTASGRYYGTYGEIYCADPFVLRIRRGYPEYKGVLSSYLKEDEEGFKRFSEIVERLESVFGKSIPHEVGNYVDALTNGLEVPLYANHPNFFIRPWGKGFPKYPDLFDKYHKKAFGRGETEKIPEKGFLMGKIIEEHQKYEEAKKSIKNIDKCRDIMENLGHYFCNFQELCDEARWYPGMIVEYEANNLQNFSDFFGYVLEGGEVPNLSNVTPTNTTPEPKNNPIETQPIESNFINPWEVEIPKLDKNE